MTGRGGISLLGLIAAAIVAGAPVSAAFADDLYKPGNWPSLVSDRTAQGIGDSLTVLILESSQASDSSKKSSEGRLGLLGRLLTGGNNGGDQVAATGSYDHGTAGQTGHSGHMVARISVVVDEVLPNGDLHVAGEQLININGKKVRIFLTGRVRRADIASSNMVLSTSLAEATIVYGKPDLTKEEKADKKRRLAEGGKP